MDHYHLLPGALDTTSGDKVSGYLWILSNKSGRHDITEICFQVELDTTFLYPHYYTTMNIDLFSSAVFNFHLLSRLVLNRSDCYSFTTSILIFGLKIFE